jgi:hypothetical protein
MKTFIRSLPALLVCLGAGSANRRLCGLRHLARVRARPIRPQSGPANFAHCRRKRTVIKKYRRKGCRSFDAPVECERLSAAANEETPTAKSAVVATRYRACHRQYCGP